MSLIHDVQSAKHQKAGVENYTALLCPNFATNPAVGDVIVVLVGTYDGQATNYSTPTAPTDTLGNTYTQIGTTQDAFAVYSFNYHSVSLWSTVSAAAGVNAVTAHFTDGGAPRTQGNGPDLCSAVGWLLDAAAMKTSAYNSDFIHNTGNISPGSTNDLTVGVTAPPAAPTLVSVSPSSGFTMGGQLVTLTGTGFDASATVTFGGAAASNVTYVNPTTLTCLTPAHAEAVVDIVVSATAYNAIHLGGCHTVSVNSPGAAAGFNTIGANGFTGAMAASANPGSPMCTEYQVSASGLTFHWDGVGKPPFVAIGASFGFHFTPDHTATATLAQAFTYIAVHGMSSVAGVVPTAANHASAPSVIASATVTRGQQAGVSATIVRIDLNANRLADAAVQALPSALTRYGARTRH